LGRPPGWDDVDIRAPVDGALINGVVVSLQQYQNTVDHGAVDRSPLGVS
jgi:hypothetical protein